jgi:hypothetical protein
MSSQTWSPRPIEIVEGFLVPIKILEIEATLEQKTLETISSPPLGLQDPFAIVRARMKFRPLADGFPIFDLVPEVQRASLDATVLNEGDIGLFELRGRETPQPVATFRFLRKELKADQTHELILEYYLQLFTDPSYDSLYDKGNILAPAEPTFNSPVQMGDKRFVNLISFMRDVGQNRGLLEKWLPANFEFDQYPLRFTFHASAENSIDIFTNGTVLELKKNQSYTVEFPSYFTAACHFFHIYDKDVYPYARTSWDFTSVSGSLIPVILYTNQKGDESAIKGAMEKVRAQVEKTLREMEEFIGAYPHPSLIIFLSPTLESGQEYAGAVLGRIDILKHEVLHCWFGRAVLPANGNAGWIDEAITQWIEIGKTAFPSFQEKSSNLTGFDDYWRSTSGDAYTKGSVFINAVSSLDKTRFYTFLKDFYVRHKFQVITHEIFVAELLAAMGESHRKSIEDMLNLYVYARKQQLPAAQSELFSGGHLISRSV